MHFPWITGVWFGRELKEQSFLSLGTSAHAGFIALTIVLCSRSGWFVFNYLKLYSGLVFSMKMNDCCLLWWWIPRLVIVVAIWIIKHICRSHYNITVDQEFRVHQVVAKLRFAREDRKLSPTQTASIESFQIPWLWVNGKIGINFYDHFIVYLLVAVPKMMNSVSPRFEFRTRPLLQSQVCKRFAS